MARRETPLPEVARRVLDLIADEVATEFNVSIGLLRSASRVRRVSRARQTGILLARSLTRFSLVDIGEGFGGRDHTTVMYALEAAGRRLATDWSAQEDFDRILHRLRPRVIGAFSVPAVPA